MWPGASHNRFEHCLGSWIPSAFSLLTLKKGSRIWHARWRNISTLRNPSSVLHNEILIVCRLQVRDICTLATVQRHSISYSRLVPRSRSWAMEPCLGRPLHPGSSVSLLMTCHSQKLTIPYSPGSRWKHEDASKMMFRDLLEKNNINISETDVAFILALIDGDPSQCRCASAELSGSVSDFIQPG